MLIEAVLKKDSKAVSDILSVGKYADSINWIYGAKEITYSKRRYSLAIDNFLNLSDTSLYPFSPLTLAIKLDQLDIAKMLIDYGADVNIAIHDLSPMHPIDYAVHYKNLSLIKILLLNNAYFSHLVTHPILEKAISAFEIEISKSSQHRFFQNVEKMRSIVERYRSIEENQAPVIIHILKKA